jgi:hypothetical protein
VCTTWSTMTPHRSPSAAYRGAGALRQEPDAHATFHAASVRPGGGRHDHDPGSRRIERERQHRAGMAPGAPEPAAGFAAA